MDKLSQYKQKLIKRKPEEFNFNVGDTVDVHFKIVEGEKERIQIFKGTVIAKRGDIVTGSFTVRHLFREYAVERTFPYQCPNIVKVEVKRRGKVRRAKLYYLRERKGKAQKVKELIG